jgi:hypothetical protein
VAGALCVNVLAQASLQANQLEEFGTASCSAFTTSTTSPADPRELVRVSGTGGVAAPGTPTNVFHSGQTLSNLGVNVPLYNLKIFGQQPSGNERVYTRFLGGSLTFDVVPASANFVLGGVNLKGSTTQLPAQAEYTINVLPSTATPSILSGFIDGNNLRAIITNTGVGQWRLAFTNTATTVSGLIGFAGPVDSVKVTFPSPIAGAPADFGTTSGFFASFKTPWTLPTARDINPNGNFVANVVEGPAGALAGPETTPQGTAGANPSDVFSGPIDMRESTACYAQFANTALFPSLPSPRLIPLGGITGDLRLEFPAPPANTLLLYFANIANGATICVFQNGVPTSGVPQPVKTPSAVDAMTNRCVAVTTESDFVVQVYGTPSQVIVNLNGLQDATTAGPALGTAPNTPTPGGAVLGMSFQGTGAAPTVVSTAADADNTAYNGGFVLAASAFTTL